VVFLQATGKFELFIKNKDETLTLRDFGDVVTKDDGLVMEIILGGLQDEALDA
jgi:hypothetical protein